MSPILQLINMLGVEHQTLSSVTPGGNKNSHGTIFCVPEMQI